jgi:hypothetical protein
MHQLPPDNVASVSGGNTQVFANIANWIYEKQDDLSRFFEAAFEAYDQNQQAHRKTN